MILLRFLSILILVHLFIFGCTEKAAETEASKEMIEKKTQGNIAQLDIKKPMSWGHRQTIYVFADDNVWKYAEHHLRKNLERDYFTTENEQYFDVQRVDFKQLESFYRFNNLIFYCDLESDKPVSQYVKSIMGESVSREVNDSFGEIYPKHNLWANDQLTLFVVGSNEESLLRLNILQAEEVFSQFKKKLAARINRKAYLIGTLAMSGFDRFPWQMQIPKNYTVFRNDKENNFISFLARGREKPDKYVAVYYVESDSNIVDKDWLNKTRAKLAWEYYDEDTFNDSDTKSEYFTIAGIKGWKLSGRWQNMKYAVGGAFQSYAFYDEVHKVAYLIDNSVYFPEGYKIAALVELEEISKTIFLK